MTFIAKSAVVVAGVVALALAPVAQAASATSSITPPTVPAELAVPQGHHVVSRYAADGVRSTSARPTAHGHCTHRSPD